MKTLATLAALLSVLWAQGVLAAVRPAAALDTVSDSTEPGVPELPQQDPDGFYMFAIHHCPVDSALDKLVRDGLPSGLTGIYTDAVYNTIRFKGTPRALETMRRRLAPFNGGASGARVLFHIQLRDVFASEADLRAAGLTQDELTSLTDERTISKIIGRIEQAISGGNLRASPNAQVTIEDGHEAMVGRRRAVIHRDPTYWKPKPVPSSVLTKITLKPKMDQPGSVRIETAMSSKLLNRSAKPFNPLWDDGGMSNQYADIGDGETVVLGICGEEPRAVKSAITGRDESQYVWHLLLGTTNFENPFQRSPAPKPPDPANLEPLGLAISELDASASEWRAAGIDPDVPSPVFAPQDSYNTEQLAHAVENNGPFLYVGYASGQTAAAMTTHTQQAGKSPVYTVCHVRGRRISSETSEIWADAKDIVPAGVTARKPLIHWRFHGTIGPNSPKFVALFSRRLPGLGDRWRITFLSI